VYGSNIYNYSTGGPQEFPLLTDELKWFYKRYMPLSTHSDITSKNICFATDEMGQVCRENNGL